MAITISPTVMNAILIAIQIAIQQLSKDIKDMTEEELALYIAGQEKRKSELLTAIDET
jgi:hypothetical protein